MSALVEAPFDRAAVGIAVIDRNGVVNATNETLLTMLGREAGEIVGAPILRHVHEDDAMIDRELVAALEAGTIPRFTVERRWRTADARTILVHEAVSPMRGGRLALLEDVTERRREADARCAHACLAQLGELAATIAHEVRNALAGIGSAVAVVGERFEPDSEERAAMEEVRRRIDALNHLAGDLVRFARPRPIRVAPVSARALLAGVARALAVSASAAQLEVVGRDVQLRADTELLSIALLHLCSGAAHGKAPGSTVRVRLGGDARTVELRVEDDGGHGAAHGSELVAAPFPTSWSRGTGLALPVARRIVEAHGGGLFIERGESEGGKQIVVVLPRA